MLSGSRLITEPSTLFLEITPADTQEYFGHVLASLWLINMYLIGDKYATQDPHFLGENCSITAGK